MIGYRLMSLHIVMVNMLYYNNYLLYYLHEYKIILKKKNANIILHFTYLYLKIWNFKFRFELL